MTTELEKQFFNTFGIEPKYEAHTCDGWGRTVEVKFFDNKEEAKRFGILIEDEPKYPCQITDRILLELICLCPDLDNVFFTDVKQLKETLLNSYINIYNYYANAEWLSDCEKELKQQVQALFKE